MSVRFLKSAPRSSPRQEGTLCYPRAPRDRWRKTRALKLVQLQARRRERPPARLASPTVLLPTRPLSPAPRSEIARHPGRRGFSPPRPFLSRFGRRRQREKREGETRERGLGVRRRRLRWGAGSSEAVSSSRGRGRLGADWRVGASPGRLRCNLGYRLGSRAPVPLLPLPFSSSRLPSSACEPPWQRRRPERLCSARGSSPGERAASSAAAAAGWSARAGQEHPQRKTPAGSAWWSRGSPAESRVRRGFLA